MLQVLSTLRMVFSGRINASSIGRASGCKVGVNNINLEYWVRISSQYLHTHRRSAGCLARVSMAQSDLNFWTSPGSVGFMHAHVYWKLMCMHKGNNFLNCLVWHDFQTIMLTHSMFCKAAGFAVVHSIHKKGVKTHSRPTILFWILARVQDGWTSVAAH